MARKLLLDLDVGADDALAIAYALGSPDLELLAVTAVFGNVSQREAQENAMSVLDALGARLVPVHPGAVGARGAGLPWEPDPSVRRIHGPRGLGRWRPPAPSRRAEAPTAPSAINRLCREWGSELAVVATGPLTNLAAALDEDPDALFAAGSVTVMGGAVSCEGNVSAVAEANIAADPASARRVLESGLPLTLVGLDVTMRAFLPRGALERWRDAGPAGEALAAIVDFYMDSYEGRYPGRDGCPLHDPLAVAVARDPLVVDCVPMALSCETEGPLSGRLFQRLADLPRARKPHAVAMDVDVDRFLRDFEERLERALRGR